VIGRAASPAPGQHRPWGCRTPWWEPRGVKWPPRLAPSSTAELYLADRCATVGSRRAPWPRRAPQGDGQPVGCRRAPWPWARRGRWPTWQGLWLCRQGQPGGPPRLPGWEPPSPPEGRGGPALQRSHRPAEASKGGSLLHRRREATVQLFNGVVELGSKFLKAGQVSERSGAKRGQLAFGPLWGRPGVQGWSPPRYGLGFCYIILL
jgi:hypothetical protein